MAGDNENKIRTIPIILGRSRTNKILLMINWLAISLVIGCIGLGLIDLAWASFLVNNIASILWVSFMRTIHIDRKLSHQLLGIQISILIVMGFVFKIIN